MHESEKEYRGRDILHGGDLMSYHALAKFAKCPAAFHEAKMGLLKDDDEDHYRFGRAAHCRILEGKAEYERRYVFGGPINPKTGAPFGQRTKAYEEWRQEQEADGRECISDDDDMKIQFLANSVERHEIASDLIQRGETEVVIREKQHGIDCQSRLDLIASDGVVDLKTCYDLDRFVHDFVRYRYANQLAFYSAMLAHSIGEMMSSATVIAVEKNPPYRCGVFWIEYSVINEAWSENKDTFAMYKKCIESDEWPTLYESERVIGKADVRKFKD